MNDERDLFVAEQLARLDPPDHRPGFWDDLSSQLAAVSPSPARSAGDTDTGPLPQYASPLRPRQPRHIGRLLAVAASIVLLVGVGAVVLTNRGDDDGIDIGTEPTTTGVVEPTVGPTSTPSAGPTASPAATPFGDPIDLTDAVDVGASRDGALRLVAVPTMAELGCEGLSSYQLYWIAPDETGLVASDQLFFNVPELVSGPDNRVAFRAACEEQSSALWVGVEDPAGTLSDVSLVQVEGWENAYVSSLEWAADGSIVADMTRFDALTTTNWTVTLDPAAGQTTLVRSKTDVTCSASELTNPTFATLESGHTYNALAAAVQAAALSCDYDGVAALAADPFTYSFGDGNDFAGFLRDGEARGDDPMVMLARLLEVDPGTSVDDPSRVVWPAFFACETTCGMDIDELHRLGYDDTQIASFQEFGGYIGYRLSFVVTEQAEGSEMWLWTYFVAGD